MPEDSWHLLLSFPCYSLTRRNRNQSKNVKLDGHFPNSARQTTECKQRPRRDAHPASVFATGQQNLQKQQEIIQISLSRHWIFYFNTINSHLTLFPLPLTLSLSSICLVPSMVQLVRRECDGSAGSERGMARSLS